MAAEGGQYRLSVPGEEPLRERSNSYSDAVVALSAVSPETNPLQRRDSDVPHSLEAGAGRRPSAAVIISQAEAQHTSYTRRSGKKSRRCSLVDASTTKRGLTFDDAESEVTRKLSGSPEKPKRNGVSAAEARLSVPHQRSDVEGESDSPPGLSVPTVEETLAYSHSPDEGGIITFDKRLTDEAAVLAFLKVHNTPPEVAIVVTGWPKRAETVFDARTGLQRTVKHATRGLPEWRKIIDLSQLVEPFGYIQAPPADVHHDDLHNVPSAPAIQKDESAESRIKLYVEDCKKLWLRHLVMTKYVDWNQEDGWRKLKLLIVQDVLQLYYNVGYEGDVVVTFPVRNPFVTVASSNIVNRLTYDWTFRATMCITLLGLCMLPYLVLLEQTTIEVSSHFRIPVSDVDTWWRKSKDRADLLRVANPRRRFADMNKSRVESLGVKWSPNFAKGQEEGLKEWLVFTVMWLCIIIVVLIIALTQIYG